MKPFEYKCIFVRKQNKNDKIVRYKAKIIAQGFSQRFGIDFDE